MRVLLALALTAVLLCGPAFGASNTFPWWWGGGGNVTPSRAQALINNEGIAFHPILPNNQSISLMNYMGVNNLRLEWYENMVGAGVQYLWSDFVEAGFNVDLLMIPAIFNCGTNASTMMPEWIASADALNATNPGHIKWFEGLNEINNFGGCWQDVATATGSSGNVVNFSGGAASLAPLSYVINAGFAVGIGVTDQTTPGNIPSNTTVVSVTPSSGNPTSITLSNNVTVAASDVLVFQAEAGYPNTATASGSSGTTVNFAAGQIPAWLQANNLTGFGYTATVTDTTNPGAIPGSTTVSGGTATTLVLSNSVTVAANDVLQFTVSVAQPLNSAGAIAWQATMYKAVKADGNFPDSIVWNFSDCCAPGGIAGTADNNNVHFYPHNGAQPLSQLSTFYNEAHVTGMGLMLTSEGNYGGIPPANSGSVARARQPALEINTLFDVASNSNWTGQDFIYELVDEGDGESFVNGSGAGYPNFYAYHNMNSTFLDIGANALTFTPTPVGYTVSGLPPPGPNTGQPQTTNYGGHQKIWQKSNGNNYVALWNEAQIWDYTTTNLVTPVTSNVTVNFADTYLYINVYDPMAQQAPISTASNASSVTVGLSIDPLIIETVTTAGLVPVVTTANTTFVAPAGLAVASPGLVLSEFQNQGGETFTISLTAGTSGTTFTATGSGVTGSGTDHMTIAGNSLSATNTILATVEVAGSADDTITVAVQDSYGNKGYVQATDSFGYMQRIPEIDTVLVQPVVSVTSPTTVIISAKTGLPGIGVTEPGYQGENFSGTISDASGLLYAVGAGVSGSGTNTLTLTGLNLTAINSVMQSLQIDAASSDTIDFSITNAFSETGTVSLAINTTTTPTITNYAARDSQPFVGGVGFGIHLSYTTTPYANIDIVMNSLNYFGIYRVRDFFPGTFYSPEVLANYATVAEAGGQFIMNICTGCVETTPIDWSFAFADGIDPFVIAHPGSVLATEGPNEVNNSPVQYTQSYVTSANASGDVLHFTSTPLPLLAVTNIPFTNANVGGQVTVTDFTNPSAIPPGTTITASDATTVTLSASTTVAGGDTLWFSGCYFCDASALMFEADIYVQTTTDANLTGVPVLDIIGTQCDFGSCYYAPSYNLTNYHAYNGYGEQILDRNNRYGVFMINYAQTLLANPSAPIWLTEVGESVCSGGGPFCVDPITAGTMLLNDMLDFYFLDTMDTSEGFQKPPSVEYVYELLDEACGFGFGLFDCTGNPQPMAVNLRNMLAILADPGSPFTAGSLNLGYNGGNPEEQFANGTLVRVMQKRSGKFEIILQNEQPTYDYNTSQHFDCTNFPMQIGFGVVPTTVNVYDPVIGTSPINTYSAPHAIAVNSCVDPLIIEVIP